MKIYQLAGVILTVFAAASSTSSLEARQTQPPQRVAIQIDREAAGRAGHVPVKERESHPRHRPLITEEERVPVGEAAPRCCNCADCQRPVVVQRRPRYVGRVPVGHRVGRYDHGVVVFPYGRPPIEVVAPPEVPHRCHCHKCSWMFMIGG